MQHSPGQFALALSGAPTNMRRSPAGGGGRSAVRQSAGEAIIRLAAIFLVAAALWPAGTALAADNPKPAENAKICKTERSLSSRIVRETCKTAAEWRNGRVDDRDKLKLGPKSQITDAFKPPAGQ